MKLFEKGLNTPTERIYLSDWLEGRKISHLKLWMHYCKLECVNLRFRDAFGFTGKTFIPCVIIYTAMQESTQECS
jgi:hypothetical protein